MRVAVLGGGLAGLYAAYLLRKRGCDVTVFEASDRIGGLLKSEKVDGFTFDTGGSHIIFSRNKELLNELLGFLDGNYVAHRRNTKIYMRGRFIKYPFENGLGDLPPEDRFFALYEYIKAWIAREKGEAKEPRNFLEWIYYWFGKGIAELYLVPYNKKIWKYPLEEMGLSWVAGRVPSPPIADVIKSAVGIPTEGYKHQLNFFYPKSGGIEALAKGIERRIRALGVEIRVGERVESLTADKKWLVGTPTGGEQFDAVFSTIPLPELIQMLEGAPKEVKKAAKGLKWNSILIVGIGVSVRIPEYHWVYFPHDGVFHRVAFISNYSPSMAPPGKGSILAEVTVPPGTPLKAERIVDEVIDDLRILRIRPNYVEVVKWWFWKYAYVISHRNWDVDVGVIRGYLSELKNFATAGRWGSWKYLNMDMVLADVKNSVGTLYPPS